MEQRGRDERSSYLIIRRVVVILSVVVIFLIAYILFAFYFQRTPQTSMNSQFSSDSSIFNASFFNEQSRLFDRGISTKNMTLCEGLNSEVQKFICSIFVAALSQNNFYCSGSLPSLTLPYPVNESLKFSLSAQDYCWLTFTGIQKKDYCDNLSENSAVGYCRVRAGGMV